MCRIVEGFFTGESPHLRQQKLSRFKIVHRIRKFIFRDVFFTLGVFCGGEMSESDVLNDTNSSFESDFSTESSVFTYSINASRAARHEPNLLAYVEPWNFEFGLMTSPYFG